jgi:hypothetical protein
MEVHLGQRWTVQEIDIYDSRSYFSPFSFSLLPRVSLALLAGYLMPLLRRQALQIPPVDVLIQQRCVICHSSNRVFTAICPLHLISVVVVSTSRFSLLSKPDILSGMGENCLEQYRLKYGNPEYTVKPAEINRRIDYSILTQSCVLSM